MSKPPIFVIADDLTGCGDIASWAQLYGVSSVIYVSPRKNIRFKSDDEIVIVNADTRKKSSKTAYASVKKLAAFAHRKKITRIFKKTDSTLRGNFAQENDALFDVFDMDILPLSPAYPEYGRTTNKGVHFINDVPLEKTSFSCDPKHPIKCSHIPTILSQKSRYADRTKVFDINTSRDMTEAAKKSIEQWQKCDAEHEVAAGSSRFFKEFLKYWNFSLQKSKYPCFKSNIRREGKPHQTPDCSDIVIVAGSKNEATLKQVQILLKKYSFVKKKYKNFLCYYHESCCESRKNKNIFVITSPQLHIPKYSLAGLVRKTKAICNRIDTPLIITCGGDTSERICSSLGIYTIKTVDTVATGIVLGKDMRRKQYVLLKSGGFGNDDFLVNCVDRY